MTPLPKPLTAAVRDEDWHELAALIDWERVQGSALRCRGGGHGGRCRGTVTRFHVRYSGAAAPLCWQCAPRGNGHHVTAAELFADPAAELRRLHAAGGPRRVRVLLRGLPGVTPA